MSTKFFLKRRKSSMSFGNKVRRRSKERIVEVYSTHLIQHFHAFLLAGGLIERDEVIVDNTLPETVQVTLKKVRIEDG